MLHKTSSADLFVTFPYISVGEDSVEEGPVKMVIQDVFEKLKSLSIARNGMEQFP